MRVSKIKTVWMFCLFFSSTIFANLPPMPDRDLLEAHIGNQVYHITDYEYPENMPRFLSSFYSTIKETLSNVKNTILSIPTSIKNALYPPHPYSNQTAYVRYTPYDEICYQEHAFRKKRKQHVQKGLEKFLDMEINYKKMPTIAFCCSGGGFRAMMSSLGFLLGAQQTGLLDTAMYMAGLSGSTWAMAPWIASKQSLSSYINTLHAKTNGGIDHINNPEEIRCLLSNITNKLLYKQYISAMDIYGGLIANTLLREYGHNRLKVGITETHDIHDGSYPLPIYTAITPNCNPYEWFEVTPYEVGSSFLKCYVPTWAHGRKFKYGTSTNDAPEQPLGYYLGIFGSAFEVNFEDILRHTAFKASNFYDSIPLFLAKSFEKVIDLIIDSPLNDVRLFPSMIKNFTYKLSSSPLKRHKTLSLIDAGIDFNLPVPPLLRPTRKVDIIIIYDASDAPSPGQQLEAVVQYAERKNLTLPPIDLENLDKDVMHIFKDDSRPNVPVIIYFPLIKNTDYSANFDPQTCIDDHYCNTFNFTYNENNIDELSGLAAFTVKQHINTIKTVIKEVIDSKYSQA